MTDDPRDQPSPDGLEEETEPPPESGGPTPPVMRSVADLSAELESNPVGRPAGPQPGAVPPSSASQSGPLPASQSGQFPSAGSGQFQAPSQSGQFPSAGSGQFQSPSQSGQFPSAGSGQFQAPSQSGQFPSAGSGQFQAPSQSGQFPSAGSGQFPAPSQSGQFPSASQSGPFAHASQSADAFDAAPAPPPKKGFVRTVVPVLLTAFVAFLVVAWMIVSQWMPPQTALIVMAGVMLVSTAAIALFTSDGQRNIVLRLLPALILTAAGVGGAYMWGQEHVRSQSVGFAPNEIRSMVNMFRDSSGTIRVAACRRYSANYEDPAWWNALFDVFNARPNLAVQCVDEVPDGARDRLGATLADRWTGELTGEDAKPTEERACTIAKGLSRLPIGEEMAAARLMKCSLRGTPVAQKCCAEALGEMVDDDWDSRLLGMIEAADDAEVRSGALGMALHGQGLTEEQKLLVEAVNFNGQPTQRVALALACEILLEDTQTQRMIQHLRASLDANCKVGVDEMPKDREKWLTICEKAADQLTEDPDVAVTSTLCRLGTDVPVSEAIAAAREVVHDLPEITVK